MHSVFGDIIRSAVDRIPGAIGGAFAAADGETVDGFALRDATEWQFLTAHCGVIMAHVQSALHTFHFGEAETVMIAYEELDVLMQAVSDGYFVIVAIEHPFSLAIAMKILDEVSIELRGEMG